MSEKKSLVMQVHIRTTVSQTIIHCMIIISLTLVDLQELQHASKQTNKLPISGNVLWALLRYDYYMYIILLTYLIHSESGRVDFLPLVEVSRLSLASQVSSGVMR